MSEKIAVVLFNLGGPDQTASIKPFLKNFFMDKNIINAPWPVRFLVSRLIAWRRGSGEALDAYSKLGGKSPLLDNTILQQTALQRSLDKDYDGDIRCFISMRYWHPMADDVARQVQDYNPDKIICLPLYPQFSTTTTRSSFQNWDRAAGKIGLDIPTLKICCYPFHDSFVDASADLIAHAARSWPADKPMRLLFSAHGLPEKVIDAGDPYQWQCEQSAAKIADKVSDFTGIENLDWQICYQSRVGPLKWIGPSTEQALEQAGRDGVGVMVYPHAFVSEHVETLVEIEEEYREYAGEHGVSHFVRIPTVMTHPKFIVGLKQFILQNMDKSGTISSRGPSLCPAEFENCCQRNC